MTLPVCCQPLKEVFFQERGVYHIVTIFNHIIYSFKKINIKSYNIETRDYGYSQLLSKALFFKSKMGNFLKKREKLYYIEIDQREALLTKTGNEKC